MKILRGSLLFSLALFPLLVFLPCCSHDGGIPLPEDGAPASWRTSLNGIWKFQPDPDSVGVGQGWYETGYDDRGWLDIHVPGNWNYLFRDDPIPSSESDYDGPAWYRTNFAPSAATQGRMVKLHFGAVCYKSEVWLNGEKIGEHEGDYLPFAFDVSDKLLFGMKNVLALRIESINAESVNTVPPKVGRYDYWIFSGVKRDVYLECTHKINIFDLFVQAEPSEGTGASVHVETRLLNAGEADGWVEVSVFLFKKGDEPGTVRATTKRFVPARSIVSCPFDLFIPRADPWTPDTPNLYICRVSLTRTQDPGSGMPSRGAENLLAYDPIHKIPPHARLTRLDSTALDAVQTHFGIRKIEVQGRRILLNGEPVVFKGINRHDEYPMLGEVMTDEIYREDLRLMKQANMNALRTAHYPNDPRIYDLADEVGLLVIEEIPAISLTRKQMGNVPKIKDLVLDYARRMVHRDKNHPCIVIWSAGDEPELFGSSAFNLRVYQAMKEIDPTRLVSYARIHYDLICRDDASDLILLNPYWGWYVGTVSDTGWFLDLAADLFPDKPIILGEFGAGAFKGERTLNDPATSPHYTEDYQTAHLLDTWEITASKEYMSGGLVWVFADFISPTRKYLRSNQFLPNRIENPIPYYNVKGIVDRYRRPKNAYLTVLGMFGDLPLHHLTVEVRDTADAPVADATVNLYLEDGNLVADQKTDALGRTVLWYTPEMEYTLEARDGNAWGSRGIVLTEDRTVLIQVRDPVPR